MKIIYYVAHPSQYYIFKNIARCLSTEIEIVLVFTDKDVIKAQLDNDALPYRTYEIGSTTKKKLKTFRKFVKKERELFKIVKRERPVLIMGTSVILAHIGWLLKIPVIIVNEDDLEIIRLSANIGYPFVDGIISPSVCRLGKYEKKAYKYEGYQKLAYLHPNHFEPSIEVAKNYIDTEKKNFIIRLSALSAHHDIGIKGINNRQVLELIEFLKEFGNIHISSERNLPDDFENFRLKINPLHLHHVLFFSDFLISDSQSMSVEAAMLGVPSVRVSDFAGRISVLEELEKKYKLTFAVRPENFSSVIDLIRREIFIDNYKNIFMKRREEMLADKNDVIPFFVNTIRCFLNKHNPTV